MTARSTTKGKAFGAHRTPKRREGDFYETPYSVTQQFLDAEHKEDGRFIGTILEPAAGNGAIVKVLEENGYNLQVISGDISRGADFLQETYSFPNMVTNPPYSLANEFIEHAKTVITHKFCMLLPVDYLGGEDRFQRKLHTDKDFPLSRIYIFTRKPDLSGPLRADGRYETGMIAYAWYVWDWFHMGPPTVRWISNQQYVLNKNTR